MAVSSIKFKIDVDTKTVQSNLKSAQSAFKEIGNAAKSSGGMLSGITSAFKTVGGAALGAVSKIGKLALSVTVFKAVNSAINMVTSSVSSAVSRIDTLNNSQRVFENMGFSADQSSKMMENLNKSIQGLPTTLDSAVSGVQLLAASTGNLDKSQEVFSALNNGIIGFGGNADMVNNAIVQLSQAFSNGKIDAETWNSMINSGLGVTLKEVASKLGMTSGELKKAMSEGTVSVDQFQDALIDLNKNGSENMASLQQIAQDSTAGIATGFANMQTAITRGVANIISEFDKMLESLTGKGIAGWLAEFGAQFESVLTGISKNLGSFAEPIKGSFGTIEKVFNAIKGLAETIVEALSTSFGELSVSTGEVFGAVADFILENMDTIEKVISTTIEIATGVLLGLGDAFQEALPYVSAFMDGIGALVDGIKAMLPEGTSMTDFIREIVPELIKAYIAYKSLQGGIKLASGAMKTFNGIFDGIGKFKDVVSALKGGQRAFAKLGTAGKVIVKVLSGLGTVVKVLSGVFVTAFKAIGAAILANPIIAAIAAVIAILVLLWVKCEWFRDGVIAIWEYIKQAWVAGVQVIGEWLSSFVDWIVGAWEGAKAAFSNGVKATVDVMKGIGTGIKNAWDAVVNAFSTAIEFIWNVVQVGFMLIDSIISGVMTVIASVILTALDFIRYGWQIAWQVISDFFSGIWEGIVAFFTPILETISSALSTAWTAMSEVTSAVWTAISDFFVGVWDAIVAFITPVLETIGNLLSAAWEAMKSVTETVWNAISSFFTTLWDTLRAMFQLGLAVVSNLVSTVWNTIKSVTSTVWNAIKSVVSKVWDAIKSAVTSAINAVKTVVTNVWNTIKSVSSTVWNGIKSVITSVWNGIKSGVSTAINAVKSTVSNVWNGIKSVTSSVWNGIKSAITTPINAAKDTVKRVIDSIKGFFSGLKLKFPSIKMPALPHFSLSGSFSLMPPSVPKLKVSWYETGGIFTGASMIGVGENGDEAVVPLSNKSRMAPFAKAISSMMKEEDSGTGSDNQSGGVVIKENTFIIRKESDITKVGQYLVKQADRKDLAKGKREWSD